MADLPGEGDGLLLRGHCMIEEIDKESFCSWYRQKTVTTLFCEDPVTTRKSLHSTPVVGFMATFIPELPHINIRLD